MSADDPRPILRTRRSDRLTVLCLLFTMLPLAGWMRGLFRYDIVTVAAGRYGASVAGPRQQFAAEFARFPNAKSNRFTTQWNAYPMSHRKGTGFLYRRTPQFGYILLTPAPTVTVGAPWWVLAVVPVAAGAWRLWRFRPVKPGHCLGCGDDLRASRDRCPECGRRIPGAV